MRTRKRVKAFLIFAGVIMGLSTALLLAPLTYQAVRTNVVREKVNHPLDSVMFVFGADNLTGTRTVGGTASLITNGKHTAVITNRHVCQDINPTTLRLVIKTKVIKASIIRMSTVTDLCELAAPGITKLNIAPLQLALIHPTSTVEPITIYGYPIPRKTKTEEYGYIYFNKQGMSYADLGNGKYVEINTVIIDIPIVPGQSGSPILNKHNQVIGIVWGYGRGYGCSVEFNEMTAFFNNNEEV